MMHPTQSQLFADHHNMLRLLHCLQVEVDGYAAGEGSEPHLPVILDIFDYVGFYPEQYHHPLEDELFRHLLNKDIDNADSVRQMMAEHKELEILTQRASRLFSSVANDTVVPLQQLVDVAREFIVRQLDHIKRENQYIYPLLSGYLGDREWDEITRAVSARRDPLFGSAIRDEYSELYHAILAAERGVAPGATARAISHGAAAF